MKKCICAALIVFAAVTEAYGQENDISGVVRVDCGVVAEADGEAFVPLRAVADALGAGTEWEATTAVVTLKGISAEFTPGSGEAVKNGVGVELSSAAYIDNDRMFVPLSSIEEIFGRTAEYDETGVTIITDNKFAYTAYEELEERMKKLYAIDYCLVGDYVYYAVLGDDAGFHRMLIDGRDDVKIRGFEGIETPISGSTAITLEPKDGYILCEIRQMRQYQADGSLSGPYPAEYVRIEL